MTPQIPFGRLFGAPADLVAALRILPAIADHTEAMEAHTALLRDMTRALERVAGDTKALPVLRKDMARVAEKTAVLEPMDGRMASIQGSMPILVEVQQHLARLPETMGRLDERIDRLSTLLERMLVSLDGLSGSVEALQAAVGPMGRLASRLPGQGKDDRS